MKIIHVVAGINYGGVENFIYTFFKKDSIFNSVIISHGDISELNRDKFEKIGFKVYSVTPKRKNIFINFIQLFNTIKKENPDVLHVHMDSSGYIALFIGWLLGVPKRICHCHVTQLTANPFFRRITLLFSNINLACSDPAGKVMFRNKQYTIINNAIDMNKFDFDLDVQKKMRMELKIQDNEFVIGHVGRFNSVKNHQRLIEIFDNIEMKSKKLLLIGDGPLQSNIVSLVKEKNLEKQVIFIKNTECVEKFYQAMDVFVFPSLYEGLGIVLIEAQSAGLPCVVANSIPKEASISNLVKFESLNEPNYVWVNDIEKASKIPRKSINKKLQNSNFNIAKEKENLFKIYKI